MLLIILKMAWKGQCLLATFDRSGCSREQKLNVFKVTQKMSSEMNLRIHFPLPAEAMLFAVKTMVLCYTLHLGCSELIFPRGHDCSSPSSYKTVGISARMGEQPCVLPGSLQSAFEVARTKGPAALTHPAPMGQQLRGNRKSILISRSEGKPGVQMNKGALFTVNTAKSIKQTDLLSNDRKWITKMLAPKLLTYSQDRKYL